MALKARNDRTLRAASSADLTTQLEVSLDDLAPGSLSGWQAYAASTAWVLNAETGFDIAIDSTVPLGAGLSSSAALLCALTLGQRDLEARDLAPMEIADLAVFNVKRGVRSEVIALFAVDLETRKRLRTSSFHYFSV